MSTLAFILAQIGVATCLLVMAGGFAFLAERMPRERDALEIVSMVYGVVGVVWFLALIVIIGSA